MGAVPIVVRVQSGFSRTSILRLTGLKEYSQTGTVGGISIGRHVSEFGGLGTSILP